MYVLLSGNGNWKQQKDSNNSFCFGLGIRTFLRENWKAGAKFQVTMICKMYILSLTTHRDAPQWFRKAYPLRNPKKTSIKRRESVGIAWSFIFPLLLKTVLTSLFFPLLKSHYFSYSEIQSATLTTPYPCDQGQIRRLTMLVFRTFIATIHP